MTDSEKLSKLNGQLAIAESQLREKNEVMAKLRTLGDQRAEVFQAHQKSVNSLEEAASAIAKLEGWSSSAMFHSFLGTKQSERNNRKQRLDLARQQAEHTETAIEDLDHQRRALRDRMVLLKNAEKEYESALQAKIDYLRQFDDHVAGELTDITTQVSELSAFEVELRQALHAGEAALDAIQDVGTSLNSAVRWGIYDILGGGMMVTMGKHHRLNVARRHAEYAHRQLQQYQKELADVNKTLRGSMQLGSFATFADYFYDGLFVDCFVQYQITDARRKWVATEEKVESSLAVCRTRLEEVCRGLRQLQSQKQELLENF